MSDMACVSLAKRTKIFSMSIWMLASDWKACLLYPRATLARNSVSSVACDKFTTVVPIVCRWVLGHWACQEDTDLMNA